MKPYPRLWSNLSEPYRNGDWHECIRRLRPLVDASPFELASRALLAALYLQVRNPGLALVHYERLLPLAVGHGDLFRALATQKRLDDLHPSDSRHARRYAAMHAWFRSLVRGGRRGVRPGTLTPRLLLGLAEDDFARIAEEAVLEDLGLVTREQPGAAGSARVVVYGRVKWWVERAGSEGPAELAAEPGATVLVEPEHGPEARLVLAPEMPSECLLFDAHAIPGLLAAGAAAPEAEDRVARPPAAPGAGSEPPSGAAPSSVAPATSPPEARPPRRRPAVARPVPDPVAEPTLAVGAPFERRRETRVAVSIENGRALLGLAGTRVKPLVGRVEDLSVGGLCVAFSHATLAQEGWRLQDSVIAIQFELPDGKPINAAARVCWVRPDDGGTGGESRVGLEFMPLPRADRERIRRHVERASGRARRGSAPDA